MEPPLMDQTPENDLWEDFGIYKRNKITGEIVYKDSAGNADPWKDWGIFMRNAETGEKVIKNIPGAAIGFNKNDKFSLDHSAIEDSSVGVKAEAPRSLLSPDELATRFSLWEGRKFTRVVADAADDALEYSPIKAVFMQGAGLLESMGIKAAEIVNKAIGDDDTAELLDSMNEEFEKKLATYTWGPQDSGGQQGEELLDDFMNWAVSLKERGVAGAKWGKLAETAFLDIPAFGLSQAATMGSMMALGWGMRTIAGGKYISNTAPAKKIFAAAEKSRLFPKVAPAVKEMSEDVSLGFGLETFIDTEDNLTDNGMSLGGALPAAIGDAATTMFLEYVGNSALRHWNNPAMKGNPIEKRTLVEDIIREMGTEFTQGITNKFFNEVPLSGEYERNSSFSDYLKEGLVGAGLAPFGVLGLHVTGKALDKVRGGLASKILNAMETASWYDPSFGKPTTTYTDLWTDDRKRALKVQRGFHELLTKLSGTGTEDSEYTEARLRLAYNWAKRNADIAEVQGFYSNMLSYFKATEALAEQRAKSSTAAIQSETVAPGSSPVDAETDNFEVDLGEQVFLLYQSLGESDRDARSITFDAQPVIESVGRLVENNWTLSDSGLRSLEGAIHTITSDLVFSKLTQGQITEFKNKTTLLLENSVVNKQERAAKLKMLKRSLENAERVARSRYLSKGVADSVNAAWREFQNEIDILKDEKDPAKAMAAVEVAASKHAQRVMNAGVGFFMSPRVVEEIKQKLFLLGEKLSIEAQSAKGPRPESLWQYRLHSYLSSFVPGLHAIPSGTLPVGKVHDVVAQVKEKAENIRREYKTITALTVALDTIAGSILKDDGATPFSKLPQIVVQATLSAMGNPAVRESINKYLARSLSESDIQTFNNRVNAASTLYTTILATGLKTTEVAAAIDAQPKPSMAYPPLDAYFDAQRRMELEDAFVRESLETSLQSIYSVVSDHNLDFNGLPFLITNLNGPKRDITGPAELIREELLQAQAQFWEAKVSDRVAGKDYSAAKTVRQLFESLLEDMMAGSTELALDRIDRAIATDSWINDEGGDPRGEQFNAMVLGAEGESREAQVALVIMISDVLGRIARDTGFPVISSPHLPDAPNRDMRQVEPVNIREIREEIKKLMALSGGVPKRGSNKSFTATTTIFDQFAQVAPQYLVPYLKNALSLVSAEAKAGTDIRIENYNVILSAFEQMLSEGPDAITEETKVPSDVLRDTNKKIKDSFNGNELAALPERLGTPADSITEYLFYESYRKALEAKNTLRRLAGKQPGISVSRAQMLKAATEIVHEKIAAGAKKPTPTIDEILKDIATHGPEVFSGRNEGHTSPSMDIDAETARQYNELTAAVEELAETDKDASEKLWWEGYQRISADHQARSTALFVENKQVNNLSMKRDIYQRAIHRFHKDRLGRGESLSPQMTHRFGHKHKDLFTEIQKDEWNQDVDAFISYVVAASQEQEIVEPGGNLVYKTDMEKFKAEGPESVPYARSWDEIHQIRITTESGAIVPILDYYMDKNIGPKIPTLLPGIKAGGPVQLHPNARRKFLSGMANYVLNVLRSSPEKLAELSTDVTYQGSFNWVDDAVVPPLAFIQSIRARIFLQRLINSVHSNTMPGAMSPERMRAIQELSRHGVRGRDAELLLDRQIAPDVLVDKLLGVKYYPNGNISGADTMIVDENPNGSRSIGFSPDAGPASMSPQNVGSMSHVDAILMARDAGEQVLRDILDKYNQGELKSAGRTRFLVGDEAPIDRGEKAVKHTKEGPVLIDEYKERVKNLIRALSSDRYGVPIGLPGALRRAFEASAQHQPNTLEFTADPELIKLYRRIDRDIVFASNPRNVGNISGTLEDGVKERIELARKWNDAIMAEVDLAHEFYLLTAISGAQRWKFDIDNESIPDIFAKMKKKNYFEEFTETERKAFNHVRTYMISAARALREGNSPGAMIHFMTEAGMSTEEQAINLALISALGKVYSVKTGKTVQDLMNTAGKILFSKTYLADGTEEWVLNYGIEGMQHFATPRRYGLASRTERELYGKAEKNFAGVPRDRQAQDFIARNKSIFPVLMLFNRKKRHPVPLATLFHELIHGAIETGVLREILGEDQTQYLQDFFEKELKMNLELPTIKDALIGKNDRVSIPAQEMIQSLITTIVVGNTLPGLEPAAQNAIRDFRDNVLREVAVNLGVPIREGFPTGMAGLAPLSVSGQAVFNTHPGSDIANIIAGLLSLTPDDSKRLYAYTEDAEIHGLVAMLQGRAVQTTNTNIVPLLISGIDVYRAIIGDENLDRAFFETQQVKLDGTYPIQKPAHTGTKAVDDIIDQWYESITSTHERLRAGWKKLSTRRDAFGLLSIPKSTEDQIKILKAYVKTKSLKGDIYGRHKAMESSLANYADMTETDAVMALRAEQIESYLTDLILNGLSKVGINKGDILSNKGEIQPLFDELLRLGAPLENQIGAAGPILKAKVPRGIVDLLASVRIGKGGELIGANSAGNLEMAMDMIMEFITPALQGAIGNYLNARHANPQGNKQQAISGGSNAVVQARIAEAAFSVIGIPGVQQSEVDFSPPHVPKLGQTLQELRDILGSHKEMPLAHDHAKKPTFLKGIIASVRKLILSDKDFLAWRTLIEPSTWRAEQIFASMGMTREFLLTHIINGIGEFSKNAVLNRVRIIKGMRYVDGGESLADILNYTDSKHITNDMYAWLGAMRQLELVRGNALGVLTNDNDKLRSIDPTMTASARLVIAHLKAKYGKNGGAVADAARRIVEWQNKTVLDPLLQIGMISEEEYTAMKRSGEWYMPLRKAQDLLNSSPFIAKVFNDGTNSAMKALRGDLMGSEHPLQEMVSKSIYIKYLTTIQDLRQNLIKALIDSAAGSKEELEKMGIELIVADSEQYADVEEVTDPVELETLKKHRTRTGFIPKGYTTYDHPSRGVIYQRYKIGEAISRNKFVQWSKDHQAQLGVDPKSGKNRNAFAVWSNGEPTYYFFHDGETLDAIDGIHPVHAIQFDNVFGQFLFKLLKGFAYMKSSLIVRNPPFVAGMLSKDAPTAYSRSNFGLTFFFRNEDGKIRPGDWLSALFESVVNIFHTLGREFPNAFRDHTERAESMAAQTSMLSDIVLSNKNETVDTASARLAAEIRKTQYRPLGGTKKTQRVIHAIKHDLTSWRRNYLANKEAAISNYHHLLKKLLMLHHRTTGSTGHILWAKILGGMTAAGDSVSRVAERKAAKRVAAKEGFELQDLYIDYIDRNITIDFSRKSVPLAFINNIYAFAAPGFQDTVLFFKNLNNPLMALSYLLRSVLIFTMPAMINYALWHDDDEWRQLDAWEKYNFIYLKKRVGPNGEKLGFWRIPYGIGVPAVVFKDPIVAFMEYSKHRDPEAFKDMFLNAFQQSPAAFMAVPSDKLTPFEALGSTLTPTALDPVYDLLINRDAQFTQNPIDVSVDAGGGQVPPEYRGHERAGILDVAAAHAMSPLDLTPRQASYLITRTFPGLGTVSYTMANHVFTAAHRAMDETSNIGSQYRAPNRLQPWTASPAYGDRSLSAQRFYIKYKQLEERVNLFKEVSNVDADEAYRLRLKYPEINRDLIDIFREVDKSIKALKKQRLEWIDRQLALGHDKDLVYAEATVRFDIPITARAGMAMDMFYYYRDDK